MVGIESEGSVALSHSHTYWRAFIAWKMCFLIGVGFSSSPSSELNTKLGRVGVENNIKTHSNDNLFLFLPSSSRFDDCEFSLLVTDLFSLFTQSKRRILFSFSVLDVCWYGNKTVWPKNKCTSLSFFSSFGLCFFIHRISHQESNKSFSFPFLLLNFHLE